MTCKYVKLCSFYPFLNAWNIYIYIITSKLIVFSELSVPSVAVCTSTFLVIFCVKWQCSEHLDQVFNLEPVCFLSH